MRKIPLIALGLFLLLFLIPISKAQVYYVSECTEITEPGTYYLTQDINVEGDCLGICTSDVVFDCQGHRVDIINWGSAFYGSGVTNITLQNCISNSGQYQFTGEFFTFFNISLNDTLFGFLLESVFIINSTISRIILSGPNSTLINVNAFDISISSPNSTLINVSALGVELTDSPNSTLINVSALGVELTDSPNSTLINTVARSFQILRSDNSVFINITAFGDLESPPIFSVASRFCTFINSTIMNQFAVRPLESNVFINNVVINNTYSGFEPEGDHNIFINNTVMNAYYGFHIFTRNNTLIGNIIDGNRIGIKLFYGEYNIIANNIISNSKDYGIYLEASSGNRIYNNLFNNTVNFYTEGGNYFNTTKKAGKRIVYHPSGFIGGNYWTNPEGKGYSDTCKDSNRDGFCDQPYVLALDDIDYLPLSKYAKPFALELLSATMSIIAFIGTLTYFITAFTEQRDYKSYILYSIMGILIVFLLVVLLKSL